MKRHYLISFLFSAWLMILSTGWGQNSLQTYLSQVSGVWVDEGTDLVIRIDPGLIVGEKAIIYVSEYCRPMIAAYLYFSLEHDKLVYVGANDHGFFRDLERLSYIHISYIVQNGDTFLSYHAEEAEYQNEVMKVLRRLPTEGATIY